MAYGRHFEKALNRRISAPQPFDRFWWSLAQWRILAPTTVRPLKFRTFESLRWWQPPSWKSQKNVISIGVRGEIDLGGHGHAFLTRLGWSPRSACPRTSPASYTYGDISAAVWPMFAKFVALMQNGCQCPWPLKIWISIIQDGDGRHFENS